MWKGWTLRKNSSLYQEYLTGELFPELERTLAGKGYRGYNVLRQDLPESRNGNLVTEFVTLVWFDSLESVMGFAGLSYASAVISERAAQLLCEHSPNAEHYDLSAASHRVRGEDMA